MKKVALSALELPHFSFFFERKDMRGRLETFEVHIHYGLLLCELNHINSPKRTKSKLDIDKRFCLKDSLKKIISLNILLISFKKNINRGKKILTLVLQVSLGMGLEYGRFVTVHIPKLCVNFANNTLWKSTKS